MISESVLSFLVLRVESKFGTEHSPKQPKHGQRRQQAGIAGVLRSQRVPAGACLQAPHSVVGPPEPAPALRASTDGKRRSAPETLWHRWGWAELMATANSAC